MWRDCGLERQVRIASQETESQPHPGEQGNQIYLGKLGNRNIITVGWGTLPRLTLSKLRGRLGRELPSPHV